MYVDAPDIHPESRLYFHTPTQQAQNLYLYPLCVGDYDYLPGYYLERDNYPGYSIMLITSGECRVTTSGRTSKASEGQVVLLNGYKPHSYYTAGGLKACWIHFDGRMAPYFYEAVTAKKGNTILLSNPYNCKKLIRTIYEIYDQNRLIREAVLSKYLTDMLNELLLDQTAENQAAKKVHESIHYMNEHFHEPLSVHDLAAHVYLSPYYFIRLFRQVTGSTPHDYLLNLRISHAKYYLKTTQISVKEIAFACGFTSESSFCNTFRRRIGSSPGRYRGTL